MSLSPREEAILAQIETALTEEDPSFAARLGTGRTRGIRAGHLNQIARPLRRRADTPQ